MKKVWVNSIFGTYKGLILNGGFEDKNEVDVELVGYPFGTYPNGKIIKVPLERISERKNDS